MKKLIFTFLVLLMTAAPSFAQTWHTANQVTLAWDAVVEMSNGAPFPATDIIKYKVYMKNAVTGGDPVELGEVTALEYVITLNTEGSYFLGAKTLRYNEANELLNESIIAWSDIPASCENNEAFGVRYFLPPKSVMGMRLK